MTDPMDIVVELKALVARGCLSGVDLHVIYAAIEVVAKLERPLVTRADFDRIFDETGMKMSQENRDREWEKLRVEFQRPGARTIDQIIVRVKIEQDRLRAQIERGRMIKENAA